VVLVGRYEPTKDMAAVSVGYALSGNLRTGLDDPSAYTENPSEKR
jgi:hypothetical protein